MEPRELLEAIDEGSAPVLIDVRSAREFARGHVPGARHVPFWSIPFRARSLRIRAGEPVVLYCGHGPRAWMAALWLRVASRASPRLMSGHMAGWRRRGLPEEGTSGVT